MQRRSFLKAGGVALGAIRGPSLATTIPAEFALPKGTKWKGTASEGGNRNKGAPISGAPGLPAEIE